MPRMRWELQSFLSARMWLRIIVVTGVIVIPLTLFVQVRFPNLQFDWTAALLKSIGLLALQLVLLLVVHVLLPPRLSVGARAIVVQHGNSARSFAYKKVEGVDLTLHGDGKLRLWITTDGRSHCYGVSPAMDLANLQAVLGDQLAVHDYRLRSNPANHAPLNIAS